MKMNNDDREHCEDLHYDALCDEDTGELPVLDAAAAQRLAAAASASAAAPAAGERAAMWLKRMDSEIEHLQTKWRTIEAELTLRENRIQELQEALQGKDDDRQALENAHGELKAQLEAKLKENERLLGLIDEERAGMQGLEARNRELCASDQNLRVQLQELAQYIDGRQGDWTQMTEKLAHYEETLAGMEQVLHGSDKKLDKKEKEKTALGDRIVELERKCAELAGRREERESACKELQNKLDEKVRESAQIRTELLQQQKEAASNLDKATGQDKLVASLEGGVARRDETIAELEAALREQRKSGDDLTAANGKLTARLAQLEETLESKVQIIRSVRAEVKESKQLAKEREMDLLKIGTRNAELEGSWLDHEQSMAELRAELLAVGEERRQLGDELAASARCVEELQAQLDSANASAGDFQAEIVVQQELVTKLEADLESKQHMMSALDRSAERLNKMSMSLHALESPLAGAEIETLASDDKDANDYFAESVAVVPTPTQAVEGKSSPAARRMFIAIDSEDGRHYPLSKDDATIGRSHKSDIRIQSVFVSRTHARLHCNDSQTVIEDAGSKNGILVNDEPVGRCVLHDGDIVSLGGKLDLRFVEIH